MDLYKAHSANLRSVSKTLGVISKTTKQFLRINQDVSAMQLTRVYALLLGAWAECRLSKLLHKAGGFEKKEVEKITQISSIKDRWDKVIHVAFSKHYSTRKLSVRTLGHTAHSRYIAIRNELEHNLYPVIELRNRLAHGQMEYPLKNPPKDVSTELMKELKTMNILTLQYKKTLLGHVIDLIECLVVSKPTFERDFDEIYNRITETSGRLKGANYREYRIMLQTKHSQGKQLRKDTK